MTEYMRVRAKVTGIQMERRFTSGGDVKHARCVWRLDFETGPNLADRGSIYLESLEQARRLEIGRTYEMSVTLKPDYALFQEVRA